MESFVNGKNEAGVDETQIEFKSRKKKKSKLQQKENGENHFVNF